MVRTHRGTITSVPDRTGEPEPHASGPDYPSRTEDHVRAGLADMSWIVFGAGGHARSVADVITRLGGIVIAVVGRPSTAWAVPVIDTDDEGLDLAARDRHAVALGVGSNSIRAEVLARCKARGVSMPAIVAATATVAIDSTLGLATVVLEHAHVGPASRVGDGVIVNTAAVVEHDCSVADLVHLGPRSAALGGVRIGEAAAIGSGATLLPGVAVGAGAVVGSGSIVRRDVPPRSTVVGVPARVIRRKVTTEDV